MSFGKNSRWIGFWMLVVIILVGMLSYGRYKKYVFENSTQNKEILEIVSEISEAGEKVKLSQSLGVENYFKLNEKYTKLLEKKYSDNRIELIGEKMEELERRVFNVYDNKAQKLIDVRFLRNDIEIFGMDVVKTNIYLFDKKGGRVVVVDSESGKGEVNYVKEWISSAVKIQAFDGGWMFYFDNRIERCNVVFDCVDTIGLGLELVDFGMYRGQVYGVDKEGMIRRIRKDGVVGWPSDENMVGMMGGISMAIDGEIYLTDGKEIKKYLYGVEAEFEIDYFGRDLEALQISTREDMEKIYVLSPKKKAVLVYEKNGKYIGQYRDEIMGTASKFVVEEKEKEMYILSGQEVYKLIITNENN